MKIAIISDTHDRISSLEKFLSFAKEKKIGILFHCGDICRTETLKRIINDFEGKVFLVLGNADIREKILKFKENPKIKIFENFGEVEIESLKIGFCHLLELALKKCQKKNYDFIFYGHTHKPWMESKKNCILVNPGNLAGLFYKATFAILETQKRKVSLIILEKIEKGS